MIARCRACHHSELQPVLSLGAFPPNEFPLVGQPPSHPAIPLDLVRCARCTLVQLTETTPSDWLFRTYWYRSDVNEAMIAELHNVADTALEHIVLERHDVVVDIGANTGTLLEHYAQLGVLLKPERVAFEPALNLHDQLLPHADILVSDYFSETTAREVLGLKDVKIVTSIAMFYDLDDPNAFVHAVKSILHPDGLWIIQFQDLLTMLQTGQYDAICHEHLEYYSLYALQRLLATNALVVEDVEHRAINGGSLRCYVRHADRAQPTPTVLAQLDREQQAGLHDSWGVPGIFQQFEARMQRSREQIQAILDGCQRQDIEIQGYGASTKANTFLSYCGIDASLITKIADRSPEKLGRMMLTGIPIVSEQQWREEDPRATLLLIHQFKAGTVQREAPYLAAGGSFLLGLPQVEWIAGDR